MLGVVCGIYGVGYFDYNLIFFVVAVVCGLAIDSFIMYVYGPKRQRKLFQQDLSTDLIRLCAKMCKAKGIVEKSDITTCNGFFDIPPNKGDVVSAIFNQAKVSVEGYEAVAVRIFHAVGGNRAELENLLKALYAIAYSDGYVDEREKIFLLRVADIFGFTPAKIAAIEHEVSGKNTGEEGYWEEGNTHQPSRKPSREAHYEVLGLSSQASDADVKRVYRKLVATHHPDRMRHKGLSEDGLKTAEEKMAKINAAYNAILKK